MRTAVLYFVAGLLAARCFGLRDTLIFIAGALTATLLRPRPKPPAPDPPAVPEPWRYDWRD